MHTSQLIPVLDTPIEMKTFLFLLAFGYVWSDKLDLTYLPPPGSQYAGGRPEDIQVPLEFPKEAYSTTFNPQVGDDRTLRPEDYSATIGIDRIPGVKDIDIVTPGSPSPSTFQNTQRVPTTTVSYAFTQTTTHPPNESFETTISPLVTGLPTTDILNSYPNEEPGSIYDGSFNSQNRPNFQQVVNQFGKPTLAPVSRPAFNNYPTKVPGLSDGVNLNAQYRPGNKETINQFGKPGLTFTGSQIPSSVPGQYIQQNQPGQQQNQLQQGQSNVGYIPDVNQSFPNDNRIINRPGYIVPTTISPQGFPSTFQPSSSAFSSVSSNNVPETVNNIPLTSFPTQESQINGFQAGTNVLPGQTQLSQEQLDDKQILNQQFPGSQSPTQVGSTQTPPSLSTLTPNVSPGVFHQQYPGAPIGSNNVNKGPLNYPNAENVVSSTNSPNVFVPSSTVGPLPSIPNQDFIPGTTISSSRRDEKFPSFANPGTYPAPVYSSTQSNAVSTGYRQRPERPQAEADRNAVILNYKNEITPEGFAYSFDTSNGIHADENGTAINGVKAEGSYSYTGDDGKVYTIEYTADEDGFRPRGDHLPTPPPIPEAIQRVIEQAEKDKEAGISDDGFYDENKYGFKKYQGGKSRQPKPSNKVISNDDTTPDDDANQTTRPSQMKTRLRPQTKKNKDALSRVSIESEEDIYEPERNGQDNVSMSDRYKIGETASQRPTVSSTDIDNNEYDEETSDDTQEPINESIDEEYNEPNGFGKRPMNQFTRKMYNMINYPGSEESYLRMDTRRRPNGEKPLIESNGQEQYPDDYINGNNYKVGTSKNRYNKQEISTPPNLAKEDIYENSSLRPNPTREPVSGSGSKRVNNKQVVKQKFFDKDGQPALDADNDYNEQNSFSTTYSPDQTQPLTEKYTTKFYESNRPAKTRPGSSKPAFRDQTATFGVQRRPTSPGLKAVTDKNAKYRPENSDNEYYNIENSKDNFDYEYDDIIQDRRPVQPAADELSSEDIRPQYDDRRLISQSANKPNGRIQESEDKGKKFTVPARPGTKFIQKVIPTVIKNPAYSYDKRPTNESGYQYIPPRRKFEHDEVKILPNRYNMQTTRRPLSRRPMPGIYYEDKNKYSKPFMTPNVSHQSSNYPEETDQGIIFGKPETYQNITQKNKYDDEIPSQSPSSETNKDQVFSDDEISSSVPLNKYASSTRRPIYQEPSVKPQYTGRIPVVTKQNGEDNRFYQGTTNTPFRGDNISLTTPMPSTLLNRLSQQKKPGKQSQYYYISDVYKTTPGQTSISSSTPYATQNPTTDSLYRNEDQYQTTYGPTETVTPALGYEYGTTGQSLTNAEPTDVTINLSPDVSENRNQGILPSTTYRPDSRIFGQKLATTVKPVLVDRYGRPIKSLFDSTTLSPAKVDAYGRPLKFRPDATIQENEPGYQNQPISTVTPTTLIDNFGRPVSIPESDAAAQGYTKDNQNEVSTARPGVLFDAFGRPVTTQGAINNEGYLPSLGNKVASKPRPSFVDAFGRPVSRPELNIQGYVPDQRRPSVTTTRPGLIDEYGNPAPTFGSNISQNTPGYSTPSGNIGQEPRIDQANQGGYQSSTFPPNGPIRGNQKYQPGYTRPSLVQPSSTFQPSTERIIGEDFSGPKQQQKFDPERGYFY